MIFSPYPCIVSITLNYFSDIDAWEFWGSAKEMKASIQNELHCHVLWRHQESVLQSDIYGGQKSLFRSDATVEDITHWILQTVAIPTYAIDRKNNLAGMYRYTVLKTYVLILLSSFKYI